METLQDRIIILLKELGLNHSQFADEIGVQRSSISHVLSGRNKPSFEFLQKLFKAYPKINADWLIIGREPMFLDAKSTDEPTSTEISSSNGHITAEKALEFGMDNQDRLVKSEDPPLYEKKNQDISISNGSGSIETVIILFKDGSFREYNPRSLSGA